MKTLLNSYSPEIVVHEYALIDKIEKIESQILHNFLGAAR